MPTTRTRCSRYDVTYGFFISAQKPTVWENASHIPSFPYAFFTLLTTPILIYAVFFDSSFPSRPSFFSTSSSTGSPWVSQPAFSAPDNLHGTVISRIILDNRSLHGRCKFSSLRSAVRHRTHGQISFHALYFFEDQLPSQNFSTCFLSRQSSCRLKLSCTCLYLLKLKFLV